MREAVVIAGGRIAGCIGGLNGLVGIDGLGGGGRFWNSAGDVGFKGVAGADSWPVGDSGESLS